MKKISAVIISMIAVISIAITTVQPTYACQGVDCALDGAGAGRTSSQTSKSIPELFKVVTNILLYIIGAVAVVMLVVGGIKYTASNGDSNAITSAKNTMTYAIVGLIVAALAYAIVNFVIANFAGEQSSPSRPGNPQGGSRAI